MTKRLFKLNTSFQKESMEVEELFKATNENIKHFVLQRCPIKGSQESIIGIPMTSTLKICSVIHIHSKIFQTNCILLSFC